MEVRLLKNCEAGQAGSVLKLSGLGLDDEDMWLVVKGNQDYVWLPHDCVEPIPKSESKYYALWELSKAVIQEILKSEGTYKKGVLTKSNGETVNVLEKMKETLCM